MGKRKNTTTVTPTGTPTVTPSNTQKKPPITRIKWSAHDKELIIEWFYARDAEGKAFNHEAWGDSNHTDEGERMLEETGLLTKPLVSKKKTADKIENMVKKYKDVQTMAEGSGWGTDVEVHKEKIMKDGSTINEHILKKCPWYYEFDDLYKDHPTVNPTLIVESGQLPRRNGQAIAETDLGGFNTIDDEDGDGQEENDSTTDSDSDHSAHSQAERTVKAKEQETIKATVEQRLVPALDIDDNDDILDLSLGRVIINTPLTIRSRIIPSQSNEQSFSSKPTKQTPKASKEAPKERAEKKTKRKADNNSDSEKEVEISTRER